MSGTRWAPGSRAAAQRPRLLRRDSAGAVRGVPRGQMSMITSLLACKAFASATICSLLWALMV